jgi:glycerol-3-phosphate cytidylyltransferase
VTLMRQELAADRASAAEDDAVLHAEPSVGYTAGTFDMFHIGHLNLLRRARSSCDRLIVGVSTDELVMQHKGKIPVLPFEERLEIVRAVRYVDEVVLQESMDKLLAWERVRFDRLFVGDDYRGSAMWARFESEFPRLGVEIMYFPYTAHTSSTLLRERLLDLPATG